MPQDVCPVIFADYRQSMNVANHAAKAALIAPLYLCMVAGTGGVYTPTNFQKVWINHQNSIFLVRGNHTKRQYAYSLSQRLVQIREMFGLSMTELSQVLRVTRPTAYSWINGTDPKDGGAKALIDKLSSHVETLRSGGFTKIGVIARQPISDGRSLIDLLKGGRDATAAVNSIRFTATNVVTPSRVKRDFGPAAKVRRVRTDEISSPVVFGHGDEV
jgi:DNA-binding transcriptional regulator YiaG